MSNIKGLGHVGIHARDMKKSIEFYQKILGFKLGKEGKISTPDGDINLALLSAGSCIIELIQMPDKDAKMDNAGPLIDHLCLEVDNIEQIKESLAQEGIKFETDDINVMPELLGGIKNIFFSGPNGERLELVEKL